MKSSSQKSAVENMQAMWLRTCREDQYKENIVDDVLSLAIARCCMILYLELECYFANKI